MGRHVNKTLCIPLSLLFYLHLLSSAALRVSLFVSSQQSWEWKASSAELLEVSCLNQLGLAGLDTWLELQFPYIISSVLPFCRPSFSPALLSSYTLYPLFFAKLLIHIHLQHITLSIQSTRQPLLTPPALYGCFEDKPLVDFLWLVESHYSRAEEWREEGAEGVKGTGMRRPWGPEISSDPFLWYLISSISAQKILTRAVSSTVTHWHTQTHTKSCGYTLSRGQPDPVRPSPIHCKHCSTKPTK